MSRYLDTPENRERVRAAADDLQGTCQGVDDALQKAFGDEALGMTELDMPLLELLDDLVLLCDACGWWCEAGDVDDGVCSDCAKEN